jgi:molybdenum cofactor guanylyltransferase
VTNDGSDLPRPRCTGAILAGGRARRLGGLDKSAIIIGGRRIVDRQLDALLAVTPEVVIVANDGQRYTRCDVPVLADAIPDAGALGGLYTALISASTPLVIAVACDMPFVSAGLLAYLVERIGNADAAVPVLADGMHPLCAVYSVRSAAPIERALRHGCYKVQDAVGRLRTVPVTGEELAWLGDPVRLLTNINGPADLERLAEPGGAPYGTTPSAV